SLWWDRLAPARARCQGSHAAQRRVPASRAEQRVALPAMSRIIERAMLRGDRRFAWLVVATVLVLVGVAAGLIRDVGRPYPGFHADVDYRILMPSEAARAAGLRDNDRIVMVDGGSPLELRARVRAAA